MRIDKKNYFSMTIEELENGVKLSEKIKVLENELIN